MALFLPGPAVSAVSGSVGGTVFSHNRGGQYMRSRSTPTNPQSPAQTIQRQRTAQNAANWQLIGDAGHAAWNSFAQGNAMAEYTNPLGSSNQLSGFGAYMRFNNQLTAAGFSPIQTPPTGNAPELPTFGVGGLQAQVTSGATLVFGFAPDGTLAAGVGNSYQLGATTVRAPGVTSYQTRELRMVFTGGEDDDLATLGGAAAGGAAYVARYGLPTPGTKIGVGIRVFAVGSGAVSPWLTATIVTVA